MAKFIPMKIEKEHIKCLTNNRGVFIQFINECFKIGFIKINYHFGISYMTHCVCE